MIYIKEKYSTQVLLSPMFFFRSWMLIYHHKYKGWMGEEVWSHREGRKKKKSEQSNGRDLERHRYLPVQLRPSYTYTEPWRPWATAKELWVCSLNGWRIQSLNSTQKKQCALGEHHLRKHLGTGQGPAAEGSCHWGALSHWCASVQRPCESSTKETTNTQGQINTTMK